MFRTQLRCEHDVFTSAAHSICEHGVEDRDVDRQCVNEYNEGR